jgi:hypothetical protein
VLMEPKKETRRAWAKSRADMESNPKRKTLTNKRFLKKFSWFDLLSKGFELGLRFSPFYQRGKSNAGNPVVNRVDFVFDSLPKAFEGYTILHMTDLHLDFIPQIAHKICEQIQFIQADLCVMTGDYSSLTGGNRYQDILGPMRQVVSAVHQRDGLVAILGNHDTYKMVSPFEEMGIKLLINETVAITRGNSKI